MHKITRYQLSAQLSMRHLDSRRGRMTDIEIADKAKLKNIKTIARRLHTRPSHLITYGKYKAKIKNKKGHKHGKLILVTAINPTSAGIGKTTVSIGLCDALRLIGKDAALALREPSLGPVFGIKGGATGGGYSQIVPMEDINLHFNGDFHAITSANNLLCSLIDNHIFQGNKLDIDKDNVLFHRCLDLNDRALRDVYVAANKEETKRMDHFSITAASEIMAIMCLSENLADLKRRLGNILVAYSKSGKPIYARDLKAVDSMAILLKDALLPNLVQTIGGSPAVVHLGPFANIAHGCNSIVATKYVLSHADYCVTEAGFGADLGAEKFFDIKCRTAGLRPNAVVLVVTIRALKLHGGVDSKDLATPNPDAVLEGMDNLLKHIDTIKNVYHLPLVVTINKYTSDTMEEIDIVRGQLEDMMIPCVINDVWGQGGRGAINLAKVVIRLCDMDNSQFEFAYQDDDSLKDKIKKVATKVYGAKNVIYTDKANDTIKHIKKLGMDKLPIVIAKTQYSLSDDMKKLGRPQDFDITVRDIEIRAGAGFLVVLCGSMLLMPGLSANPSAINMTIDDNTEKITGLF